MASKIRHEWYQTESDVVVSVFIRNVKEEDLKVELNDRSLSLTVKLPTGSDVVFDLDPLAHEIDVKQSKHRVLQPKIELTLKKKEGGIKWTKIEGEDNQEAVKMASGSSSDKPSHAYPSSSRKQHNWDAIVKASAAEDAELEKEFSKLLTCVLTLRPPSRLRLELLLRQGLHQPPRHLVRHRFLRSRLPRQLVRQVHPRQPLRRQRPRYPRPAPIRSLERWSPQVCRPVQHDRQRRNVQRLLERFRYRRVPR